MPVNPKNNIIKLERILKAWNHLASDKTFAGMTIQQFEAYITTCKNARLAMENFENQLTDASALRDSSDEVALGKAQLVKNAVLCDPELGINSSVYEAMGYVRQVDRKSGLTHKKQLADKQG
jgi:hypothetical protein